MARIHKTTASLLPDRQEPAVRCSLAKPHRCLRTECLASALLVGLLAMFVTWGSSAIVKAGYDLVQARACLTKVEKENELLRLEMARLKSPQRIQGIAAGQLGMVKPQKVYVAARAAAPAPADEGSAELASAQRPVLFGNARAEAHNIR